MKQLVGRVAVVTGAGAGLGRALAHELARRGCRLALVDVRADALAEVAAELRVPVSTHVADVSDGERMAAVVDEVLAEHENVHVLVNNAGVTTVVPFAEHDPEDFDRVMRTNFNGVVNGCRLFLPALLCTEGAAIVNVSSMVAWGGAPLQAAYCASKAAIRSLSETLAAELSGTGVSVTCAFPGAVRTELLSDDAFAHEHDRRRVLAMVEPRALAPEPVARAIVRATLRRRLYVWVGWHARLWAWLMRWCPTLLQRALGRYYRRRVG